MAQARTVADALLSADPDLDPELVPITTRGDRARGEIAQTGGKGVFTAELETALRTGEIHLAVHSAKDVPVDIPSDLMIGAISKRIDPADALVTRAAGPIESLPNGAIVATGSLRRRAQLLTIRADLRIVGIRGNVETRVRKVLEGASSGGDEERIDATVLAMAGLIRSGLLGEYQEYIHPFDVQRFIPAAGQGALIVQSLTETGFGELLNSIDDVVSSRAVLSERSVLRELNADCRAPIAVHIYPSAENWEGRAMRAEGDPEEMTRIAGSGRTADQVAASLTDQLKRRGAETPLPD
jgi:hydroxymethylbilane synthase